MSGNQLLIFSILLCGMSILTRWGNAIVGSYSERRFEDWPLWLRAICIAFTLGPIAIACDGDFKVRASLFLILVAWGIVATHGTVKRND